MLFSIVKDPVKTARELNHDLDIICQWAHQWKMEFNPDPTKQATEVLFSCKKSSPNHPQLIFNGTVVTKVNEQKHLGLMLDSGLSFEKHLNAKVIKDKKNVGIIKHLSKYLPLKTLDQMFKALVRPHLDYCDIIYHIPSVINQPPLGVSLNSLMEKIERVQYQSALAITAAWHGSSRSKLYEELGWESLSDRRSCRRILQIHKIFNNKTPSYLKDKLPPNRRVLFGGVFRNTFRECVNQIGTGIVFSLMQLSPGMLSSNILMTPHLLIYLKAILIPSSVLFPKVFSVYTIQEVCVISFN